jgi:uncharacterized protein YcfL
MKVRNRWAFGFAFLGLLVSLVGCATGPGSPQIVDTTNPRARLITGSRDLLNRVVMVNPRFRPAGNLTQAEVSVQNLTDDRYVLEYKFEWSDPQGFSIGDAAVWHRFTLSPHQIREMSSTGKTPDAQNLTLTIRYPDDAFINQ